MQQDSFVTYLDEIGRMQLLSEAEEQNLSKRVLAGDKRAFNKMVEANLRLVVAIASHYQGKGLPMDDLVSEGNLGLMKAAAKFDAMRGKRFAGYAAVFVRQAIEKALSRESGEQRVESTRNGHVRSVDTPFNGRANRSLLSVLVNAASPLADERTYSAAVELAVERALRLLGERESHVINAYFGITQDHQTMQEIALDMHLKRERVRQIRDRAVRRLKKHYKQYLSELRS